MNTLFLDLNIKNIKTKRFSKNARKKFVITHIRHSRTKYDLQLFVLRNKKKISNGFKNNNRILTKYFLSYLCCSQTAPLRQNKT
jgi:hypothetical protein